MGCRDCNSALETAQNEVALWREKYTRAGTALLALGGVLDEYEDEVRAIRGTSAEEAMKKLGDCAVTAVAKMHEFVEEWISTEEQERGK